jgi:DNA-directed RNA polymerase specialized sigma24 family protein
MGHTSVPEPAIRWADAVRNSRLAPPGADVDPAAVSTIATLFRDHHGELVRLALLMVGDVPTAEDVVQDVYTCRAGRWPST